MPVDHISTCQTKYSISVYILGSLRFFFFERCRLTEQTWNTAKAVSVLTSMNIMVKNSDGWRVLGCYLFVLTYIWELRCVTSLSGIFYPRNNIICFVPPSLYNHVCYLDFSSKFRNKCPFSSFLKCFFLALIWWVENSMERSGYDDLFTDRKSVV